MARLMPRVSVQFIDSRGSEQNYVVDLKITDLSIRVRAHNYKGDKLSFFESKSCCI